MLTKTPVKFRKDQYKIIGGVAITRLDTICDRQSDGWTDNETDAWENNMSPDPDLGRRN